MSKVELQIYDVVIVGGGPVGMGLAIDLAQRGHSICVIERYAAPQPVPKGQNLTQRTMEHMIEWGVEPEIRKACPIPKSYGLGGLTAYGTLLSGYTYDWLKRELVAPYYATDNERLPQYDTEQVLRDRVAELPNVEVKYGWAGAGFSEGNDTVEVFADARDGSGEKLHVQGRYVVGCDGSRSVIREAAGITQTLREHDNRMVLLVFKSEELHELLTRFPGKSFYCVLHPDLEGYWQFLGRVNLGSTWFFHAPVPADTTEDNFDFASYLYRAIGTDFSMEFEYIGFWDLRIAVADSYKAGRVFIAGDAAHSHPPYGGYGINTGFEDARNLSWKLDMVLRGKAHASLLESYDAERRPVFESTASDFIEKAISEDRHFLRTYDPSKDEATFVSKWSERSEGAKSEVDAFEPNYEGSPVIPSSKGKPSAVGSHRFDARPGHHLAPRLTANGDRTTALLTYGFSLLLIDPTPSLLDEARALVTAAEFDIAILVLPSGGELSDYGRDAILVRPDHFVAWSENGTLCGLAETLNLQAGAEAHCPAHT